MIITGISCDGMHDLNDRLNEVANENKCDITALKTKKETLKGALNAPAVNLNDFDMDTAEDLIRAALLMGIKHVEREIFDLEVANTIDNFNLGRRGGE